MRVFVPISVGGWTRLFSRWDVLAILLTLGLLVFLGEASRNFFEPLAELQRQPPSLDPRNLPEYAARTTLRMLIAMVLSLVFTFTYATLAAKSRSAERLLVPLLDILQSVPILGFISVTVVFFMSSHPGACSAPNLLRSLRFSPAKPGTWRSASISRCARCRLNWKRRRVISGSAPGCGSGGSMCPLPPRSLSGT